MDPTRLEALCRRYVEAFNDRDLECLRLMLAPTVRLRDWELSADGLDDVMAQFSGLFALPDPLTARILRLYFRENGVAMELEITIGAIDVLNVVDLIDFMPDGRISFISAFKQ
ncbi:MAG: nuclear transport factor 2 family protein [Alphaproteobacteria bacterium]|nr:nuclear transport factor 2 family protein [Alphaproteobacteria bacterium]